MKRPPLYVAVHEAGHAISMLSGHSHRWVDYVSLTQLPDHAIGFTSGNARFNIGWADELAAVGQRDHLVAAAKADSVDLIAGPVAEYRFRKLCGVTRHFLREEWAAKVAGPEWHLPEHEDFSKVRQRLRWCDPSKVQEAFIEGWNEAEVIVKRHWRDIVELGRWLHRQGHIMDEELFPWWQQRVNVASGP